MNILYFRIGVISAWLQLSIIIYFIIISIFFAPSAWKFFSQYFVIRPTNEHLASYSIWGRVAIRSVDQAGTINKSIFILCIANFFLIKSVDRFGSVKRSMKSHGTQINIIAAPRERERHREREREGVSFFKFHTQKTTSLQLELKTRSIDAIDAHIRCRCRCRSASHVARSGACVANQVQK